MNDLRFWKFAVALLAVFVLVHRAADRRIAFRPHRFNVQLDTWSVPHVEVTGARPVGMRMLSVLTRDGGEHWLVTMSPGDLAARLEPAA